MAHTAAINGVLSSMGRHRSQPAGRRNCTEVQMPLMHDPEHPPDTAHVPKMTSLPPSAKTWNAAGFELKGMLALIVALIGAKWGFVPKEILCGLLVAIPMADYARRKAQGALDLQGILEMIDRMRR